MRPDPALARVPGRHQPFMGRASRQQPVRRVVKVKRPRRLPRPMSEPDLEALLSGLKRLRDLAMFLLMLDGGLRPGEVLSLHLEDISYGRRRVTIRKTYTERMIPLHPQAADALRDLIGHARTVGAAARYDTWAHQSVRWVFMHRGQPLGKHYLFDEPLEIACRQAGLIDAGGRPTVSAHRFRHILFPL
jgi:integrase